MPILADNSFEFFSHSPHQTRRLGIHLGGNLKARDVICLEGNLGTGKTVLVQGIAQGWGAMDPVSSPTYMIVNEYRRPDKQRLFHLDAYRLENELEAEFLDFDRMMTQGPIVIEWAERIKAVIPEIHLWIYFDFTGVEHRSMMLQPHGQRYESLVDNLRHKLYGDF